MHLSNIKTTKNANGLGQSTLMQIMDLRASLKRVAGSLAFYPLTKEKRHRNNYALRIEHTKNIIRLLQTNPALNHDEISTQLVDRLNDELTLSNKTADQLLSGEPGHNHARSARSKIDPLVEKMEDILRRLVKEQETAITLAGNRLIENADSSNNLVAGFLLVGLAIGWLIAGIISNPVTDAARYR